MRDSRIRCDEGQTRSSGRAGADDHPSTHGLLTPRPRIQATETHRSGAATPTAPAARTRPVAYSHPMQSAALRTFRRNRPRSSGGVLLPITPTTCTRAGGAAVRGVRTRATVVLLVVEDSPTDLALTKHALDE